MAFPFTGGGDGQGINPVRLPAGGGDPLGMGYGSRLPIGGGNYLARVRGAIPYIFGNADDQAPNIYEDGHLVLSNEGGYYLRITVPIEHYWEREPNPPQVLPYIVRFRDLTGQAWPLLTGGSYRGRPGANIICEPMFGGTTLRFASPHAPEGIYTIEVEDYQGQIEYTGLTARLIRPAYSREVNSVRAMFPPTVYNPYPD